jgi:hypothetical protein
MKVDSSFSRLFRQSRYATSAENDLPRQDRRELFAVAAVAFTIRHDKRFAGDFLVRVAGIPKSDLDHNFHIEPQRSFCADLAITDQTSNKRYVVEFKVGARLMEKQDARSKTFNKPGGYGYAFKNLLRGVSVYTTLTQQRDFDDFNKDGREYRTRTWNELIPNRKESSLEKDLLDSLGDLGISVLRLRNIKNMKNAKLAATAVNIHDLLRSVLDQFKKAALDVERDEFYEWVVGMYMRPRANQHTALKRWLGQDWGYIGWIGYLLPKDAKEPQLSVWLCFGEEFNSRRDESIRALQNVVSRGQVEPSRKYNDLLVQIPANNVTDEKKWFTDTLETVLQFAQPFRGKKP